MKKLFTLFVITALVVSTGIVGCGGTPDNKTTKPDTGGKKAPKMDDDTKTKDDKGKRKKTAAGGEAKAVAPPN